MCFILALTQKAVRVEPRAESDKLDLHGKVWVLSAPRGGANCVNPQLASMPNATEPDLALGPPFLEVLDVQLSGKPFPHAGGGSAPRLRPSTPQHMCVELSRCYHALAGL